MMHEEMCSLQRRITRQIHKEHRVFFRDNWDKFCAWANETARECHRYWVQQWGEYRKWRYEVERPRFDRILDTQGEAQRRGDKDRIEKALKCQDRLRRRCQLREARIEEELRLDLERQGWVRCDIDRNRDHGLFASIFSPKIFWVPPDFVNPVGCVFGFEQAREPTANERLLCDCALLSVLHDSTVRGADPRICAAGPRSTPRSASLLSADPRVRAARTDADWQFNIDDSFVRKLRGHLAAMTQDGRIQRAWERVRKHLPSGTASATAPVPDSDKPTPETDTKLIYQASAAEFYNIPKSMLSKAAKRKPSEPGYLWSDTDGNRRWYRKSDLARLSRGREKLRGS
jgi:hypothetical protein